MRNSSKSQTIVEITTNQFDLLESHPFHLFFAVNGNFYLTKFNHSFLSRFSHLFILLFQYFQLISKIKNSSAFLSLHYLIFLFERLQFFLLFILLILKFLQISFVSSYSLLLLSLLLLV